MGLFLPLPTSLLTQRHGVSFLRLSRLGGFGLHFALGLIDPLHSPCGCFCFS